MNIEVIKDKEKRDLLFEETIEVFKKYRFEINEGLTANYLERRDQAFINDKGKKEHYYSLSWHAVVEGKVTYSESHNVTNAPVAMKEIYKEYS